MPSSPGYYNHAAVISLSTVNLHESNLDGVNDNDDVGVDGFSAQQLFSFAWQVARGMVSKWIKSEVTVGLPSKKPYAETIPEEHSRHYFMSSSVTPLWAFFFFHYFFPESPCRKWFRSSWPCSSEHPCWSRRTSEGVRLWFDAPSVRRRVQHKKS